MGFWGDWQAVQESVSEYSPAAIARIESYTFHHCANEAHCTNDCGLELPSDNAVIVQMSESTKAALRDCRGNTTTICDPRYKDRLCAVCSLGYFSLGGQCLRCLEPSVPFVIGCILLIIAAWFLINRYPTWNPAPRSLTPTTPTMSNCQSHTRRIAFTTQTYDTPPKLFAFVTLDDLLRAVIFPELLPDDTRRWTSCW
jgi:hypothetical protein